jgi:hypothetical protein
VRESVARFRSGYRYLFSVSGKLHFESPTTEIERWTDEFAHLHRPEPEAAVNTGRGESPAVRTKANVLDPFSQFEGRAYGSTGGSIPDSRRVVAATSGDKFAVRAECRRQHVFTMSQLWPDLTPGRDRPDSRRAVAAARHDECTIGAKPHIFNHSWVEKGPAN